MPLLAFRLRESSENAAPPEVRQKLKEWHRSQTIFTLSLNAELFRILDRFAAEGIETLLVKGPALATRCYGDPAMRQYGDLDLILRHNDIHRSTQAMIALGYQPKVPLEAIEAGKLPGEYVFLQPDTKILVEFHTEHTFRYHPQRVPIDKLFQRKTCVEFDGRGVPVLSVEDEVVLICIHGAKHLWQRLMWVADVAALVTNQELNWERAIAAGSEVGAGRMLRLGLALATKALQFQMSDAVERCLAADPVVTDLAAQIARRLPAGETEPRSLAARAKFRMNMREGFFSGAAYLLRLTLSPTEEDWSPAAGHKTSWLRDAAGRPFRLARKYGRDGRA